MKRPPYDHVLPPRIVDRMVEDIEARWGLSFWQLEELFTYLLGEKKTDEYGNIFATESEILGRADGEK
jgi:hypothetical protein